MLACGRKRELIPTISPYTQRASPDTLLTAKRTLELANKAYFLYVT